MFKQSHARKKTSQIIRSLPSKPARDRFASTSSIDCSEAELLKQESMHHQHDDDHELEHDQQHDQHDMQQHHHHQDHDEHDINEDSMNFDDTIIHEDIKYEHEGDQDESLGEFSCRATIGQQIF